MSKFGYDLFSNGIFVVNSEYGVEEAIKIFEHDTDKSINDYDIDEALIYYGFGSDDEGEGRWNCWWLELDSSKRTSFIGCIKVYAFVKKEDAKNE